MGPAMHHIRDSQSWHLPSESYSAEPFCGVAGAAAELRAVMWHAAVQHLLYKKGAATRALTHSIYIYRKNTQPLVLNSKCTSI